MSILMIMPKKEEQLEEIERNKELADLFYSILSHYKY
jgi:hypothetical protein